MSQPAVTAGNSQLSQAQKGVMFCIIAHLFWGVMAYYFSWIIHIPPYEIAVHRGLWSLPIAAVVIWWFGQWGDVWRVLKRPRHILILAFTGSIILFNWGFYVWSIEAGRALEASLGYFINPLLNVVAGYFLLGERFRAAQLMAIGLAAVAVVMQTIATGVFPWLGLMLGGSFCLYGLVRKMVPIGPTQGFFVEVALLSLPLLGVAIWLGETGRAKFGGAGFDTLMLMGCGVLTAGALIFFAASLKLIRYSTAGLLQYISPSLVFLTAIFVLGEPMDRWKFMSFVTIWVALAVYSWSAFRDDNKKTAHVIEKPL